MARAILAAALLLPPGPALAHNGAPPGPHDLWAAWNWDPAIVGGLALAAGSYLHGVQTAWRRAGRGRGVATWRVAAFVGGLAGLFVALVSPLDALGSALLSAHMVQHLALMVVAAPLLVLGASHVAYMWALPMAARRGVGVRWMRLAGARRMWAAASQPPIAWALHALALWVWHLPSLYQQALQDGRLHVLEHASFLGTGLLFWWVVAHAGRQGRSSQAAAVLYVFAMMMQGGVLGALMTFSSVPWYPAYAATVGAWGLTPLEDQVLAGLLMWVPGTLVYTVTGLVLTGLCLRGSEQRLQRVEQSATSRYETRHPAIEPAGAPEVMASGGHAPVSPRSS